MVSIPEKPKILVVGSGAREHAIVWKLAQSPHRPQLFAAPGNPGIGAHAELVPIAADDVHGLVEYAANSGVDLVVVGPEAPLALGIVDLCSQRGVRAFGPTQAAARLESSKSFAKQLMQDAGVPTASFATFTDAEAAKAWVRSHGAPIVVKADGLAAGKGVVVATTVEEALLAIDGMLLDRRFGEAGSRLVLESFLRGSEVSLMFFVDGESCIPMLPARDHKRVGDGDTGPNTGGMGAFAPVTAFLEADGVAQVESRIVRPTLRELRKRGVAYQGVLYVGLMMTDDGPFVVEFNARFGDPEAEAVLPLLNTDLLDIMWATTAGRLADVTVEWRDGAAVCVVLCAPDYPERPRTGQPIAFHAPPDGGEWASDAVIFHAGTKLLDGQVVTSGGRVVTVSGWGSDIAQARQAAYALADTVQFEGRHMRSDIATRLSL